MGQYPQAEMHLAILAAATTEPKLTSEEMRVCLNQHKTRDRHGRGPIDADWIPTFDMNAAAAMAWDIKAGKCSNLHSFQTDEQSFKPEQIFEHCRKQAVEYRKRVAASVPLVDPMPVVK